MLSTTLTAAEIRPGMHLLHLDGTVMVTAVEVRQYGPLRSAEDRRILLSLEGDAPELEGIPARVHRSQDVHTPRYPLHVAVLGPEDRRAV